MLIERQKYSIDFLKECAEYLKNHTLKETSLKFNINYYTLKNNLTKLNLRKPIREVKNKIKNCNENYFENIDNHNKAYILGLLYSDGNIQSGSYKNTKIISISLQLCDKYILDFIKEELQCTSNISIYKNSCKLSISNKKLYDDLIKLGLKENKSHLDYILPNIDNKYMNSFIRGYFDGDGCITIKNSKAIVVSICCNSKLFLENLQEKLQNNNIFSRILTEKRKHNNLYVLYLKGRENQLNFKNYIYNNYICLKRKYDKFMKIPC